MANSVITSLNATGYNGQFTYEGASGSFNTDGQKNLANINGNKEGVGSFDAYRMGDAWQYNPHFSDITKATELVTLMTGAITAVQAELDEEE